MWDPHPRPVLSTTTTTTTTTKKLKCIVLGGAGAGKTSILRRYFHNQFDFHRMPTLGSDFYTRKILEPQTGLGGEEKKEPSSPSAQKRMLSMQVWDTPGRERFSNRKPMYTAAFSDNFFKEIDAALLVYDITSSTSFTHVLKWHADLMERIRRLEAAPFPVIIVANKMDIFDQQHVHKSQKKAIVAQRDVMGLAETFRGKDSPYEYSANHPTKVISSSSLSSSFAIAESSSNKQHHHHHNRGKHRHEISTYMGTGDQTSYLEAVLNNEVVRGSYLESLLSTEDGSHPDKDMVLLWTMRNGLKHMEVSALDGK